MTTEELLTEQQRQIEDLIKINNEAFATFKTLSDNFDQLTMLYNWQKIEIKMLEQKQFVKTDN
jgi:hypothetical protein